MIVFHLGLEKSISIIPTSGESLSKNGYSAVLVAVSAVSQESNSK